MSSEEDACKENAKPYVKSLVHHSSEVVIALFQNAAFFLADHIIQEALVSFRWSQENPGFLIKSALLEGLHFNQATCSSAMM